MHKYRTVFWTSVCTLGVFLGTPDFAQAQIFKSSGSGTADSDAAQKKATDKPKAEPVVKKTPVPKAQKTKAPPPKATKPKAVQPKAVQPKAAKTTEPAPTKPPVESESPVAETTEASPPATSSVAAGRSECETLPECVSAIQETLDGMSTAEDLRRLDALTKRAEALIATGGTDSQTEPGGVVAPSTAPGDAATATDKDETSVPVEMTQEEIAALQARLEKVESELAAVSSKAAANEEKIAAREPVKGFKIQGPGDSVFTIGALLQTRMEMQQDGAPTGEDWSYGLYVRRMRLMFYGQLTKWLNFFIETEQANFGKNGDWGGRMFIQDAYVEFNPHPAFQLDVGMMLPALSRHANQSATSLLGMDYHGTLVKYPTGSTMVWRDMGVMVRGLVLKDRLDYRLAVWSGVHGSGADPRNPKDLPRLSGRLTANVFDAEGGGGAGGMFFDGLYIKKDGKHVVSTKRVLSFGVSFDWQPDLNVQYAARAADADPETPNTPIAYSDYVAVAGDVFWDLPFGENKILSANGQMDFYYYNHGDRRTSTGNWYYNTAGNSLNYTGWGMFGEYGIRYSMFQALFSMDVYDATEADGKTGDYLNFSGGFNYYMLAHAATFKLEVGADRSGDNDWKAAMKLQLQLVF